MKDMIQPNIKRKNLALEGSETAQGGRQIQKKNREASKTQKAKLNKRKLTAQPKKRQENFTEINPSRKGQARGGPESQRVLITRNDRKKKSAPGTEKGCRAPSRPKPGDRRN